MNKNTENKNVLITGGAGFIGSNLALKLLGKGYSVTVLDTLSEQIHGKNPLVTSPLYRSIADKVNFIHGDICDRQILTQAIAEQKIIVHLAAETGTGQSMYEIKKYSDVNIGGTALLLDILANQKTKVEKVVVASSRAIYGEGKYLTSENKPVYPLARIENDLNKGDFECKNRESDSPLVLVGTDECSQIHPTSVYGISKHTQEQLIMSVCPTLGIAPVSLRYQNVYGPGQSLSNPYSGILSIFSTRILNGNALSIFEDGKESRDFVYIDDVVEATWLALEKEEANGHCFNVGSGVSTDVLTVAQTLIQKYEKKVDILINGNYRLGDIRHNYADLTKIKNTLHFNPQWSFAEGIERFAQWVCQQPIQEDLYEKSIQEMKEKGLYK